MGGFQLLHILANLVPSTFSNSEAHSDWPTPAAVTHPKPNSCVHIHLLLAYHTWVMNPIVEINPDCVVSQWRQYL